MIVLTFTDLQTIADKYIKITSQIIPQDSFEIARSFNIRIKNSAECKEDFVDDYPLKRSNAVYALYKGEYTIYYDEKNVYKNFSIAHEIAHHILKHETDGATNHHDANLLAAIIVAPAKNFKRNKIKTSRQLSETCLIPVEVAEMYWKEINTSFSKRNKKLFTIGSITSIILLVMGTTIFYNNDITPRESVKEYNIADDMKQPATSSSEDLSYYATSSGKHYHTADCQYIKYKTNVIPISLEEAIKLNLNPCKKCI